MASSSTLQLHAFSFLGRVRPTFKTQFGFGYGCTSWKRGTAGPHFVLGGSDSCSNANTKSMVDDILVCKSSDKGNTLVNSPKPVSKLQETILSLPPVIFLMKNQSSKGLFVGLCIMASMLVIMVRIYVIRKSRYSRPGSVADLVRRGQLRSDRRGISSPLKYDDPFNNPLVKVGKNNSTVEMCGKVYRLAPVTLTKKQQDIHQKRRSRAYQWKRPTMFLKEGDSVPADVDPDTVRWIPANHPFATTASEIDEGLAQTNVYQKHGVPFRIKAEHEALQRKLEVLQTEQKLGKLVIDPGAAKDFERPFKSHMKSEDQVEKNLHMGTLYHKSDRGLDLPGNSTSDEMQTP